MPPCRPRPPAAPPSLSPTFGAAPALWVGLALGLATGLDAQDSKPTSRASGERSSQPPSSQLPRHDLRLRLRELLDRADPPATVELDGRIYEVKKLQRRGRELWRDDDLAGERLGAATVEALVLGILREKLTASRRYLSDRAFEQVQRQHAAEYDGTFFNLRTMATRLKGYPALGSYWAWYRLRASFGQSLEKALTTEKLKEFLPQVESFLVLDRVQVRAMFFSARDKEKGQWNFGRAHQNAAAARARLDRGHGFAKVAAKADPLPVGQALSRLSNYNVLRQDYGATEYGELLAGGSPFDIAFFDTRQGEATPPVQGHRGYWILKVKKRKRSGGKIELAGNTKELVRRIYVHHHFQKWVTATLDKVVLKLKPRRPK